MEHRRIALLGKLRGGKDSAADFLKDTYGFTRVSIAEAVKATVNAAFAAAGIDTSRKGFMRAPLQEGGLAARQIDPEIWVGSLVRRYQLDVADERRFVCPDTRYVNEAAILRQHGFLIVRIEASRKVREERALAVDGEFDLSAFEHASETDMDAIQPDLVLQNETEEDRERMFHMLACLVTDDCADA